MTVEKVNPNEPNALLYEHWRRVFRRIRGFEDCLPLRRVRCPTGAKDMDFFLLSERPRPKIGLVECEGKNHPVPQGIDQLLVYLAAFLEHHGDGQRILDVCIRDAFNTTKLRGRVNVELFGSLKKWLRRRPLELRTEDRLIDLLGRASKKLVPILLYYREEPLSDPERRILKLALRSHRLYVGTCSPTEFRLIDGRYI